MKGLLQNVGHYVIDAMFRTVRWDEERCNGCLTCYEVCPVGCCLPDPEGKKILPPDGERCVACSACVLQCPEGALELA
jgi:NAD-dependent dihydropyrimidine dehydrogenase PreA subunit